jgi:hypothetical protein
MGEEKSTYVAHSYGVDSNWYANSGAPDHATGDLEKLVVRDKYNGTDQIYTASGPGMDIKHIGHSIIRTPGHDLSLNNVLHVPKSSKNLASVHRITSDNNVFFKLHPDFFFIKDRSQGGLFWKAHLREDSILSLVLPPLQLHPNKSLVSARFPHQDGMLV